MVKKFELTNLQKSILANLTKSELQAIFYWTGGTALAFFYLKHRLSFDIDLFSKKMIQYHDVKKFADNIANQTGLKKIEEKKIMDRWEFFLTNHSQARLDFAYFDYKSLKPHTNWQGIWVDSFEDIVANKTMALIDRHDPKDAFDIYHIITQKKYSAKKLLKLVKQKFQSDFPVSLFWSQCLLGAKELNKITPLMLVNTIRETQKIIDFFEKQSADDLKEEL